MIEIVVKASVENALVTRQKNTNLDLDNLLGKAKDREIKNARDNRIFNTTQQIELRDHYNNFFRENFIAQPNDPSVLSDFVKLQLYFSPTVAPDADRELMMEGESKLGKRYLLFLSTLNRMGALGQDVYEKKSELLALNTSDKKQTPQNKRYVYKTRTSIDANGQEQRFLAITRLIEK